MTWTTPLTGFDFSVNWRCIGAANLDTGETGCADCHIQAFNYFDLAASYRFRDRYTVRVGVNNVFDRDPPIIGQGQLAGVVGSGNTFRGSLTTRWAASCSPASPRTSDPGVRQT